MRIAVEPGACLNTGVCASLAPGHFVVDVEGEMQVVVADDVSPADLATVALAVQACPAAALSIN